MPTLVHALLAHAADRPAVHHGGETTTYGDLASGSASLAQRLIRDSGVGPGDRVAMLLEPGPDFVRALFGIWRARAAAVVLTPLHPPNERARLLADAGANLVLASPALASAARESGVRVIIFDEAPGPAVVPVDRLLPRPDDLALLVYTSGTTSAPKGVLLRHHHVDAQCAALAAAWEVRPDDVLVHALPLHHVHGLVIALLDLLRAGGSVAMLSAFDAHAVVEACEGATVFMGVPTMYARLVDALDDMDDRSRDRARRILARLRLCTSGSAALPVTLGGRWGHYAGQYPAERFGMTELGVALTNPVRGERVPGSVGFPVPGVRIRVAPDGGDGDEGELLVAGPSVFEGYWQRPEETRAAFVDDGGVRWFKTGDTVRLGADGRVRVLGRTSVDILKSAGYKLSAPEIEEALRRHPAVRDAAVVGLPDETYGQRVAAAVMLDGMRRATPDELLAFLREELAPYKLPRTLRIVDDVPRNALGKVLKPELAKILAEGPVP